MILIQVLVLKRASEFERQFAWQSRPWSFFPPRKNFPFSFILILLFVSTHQKVKVDCQWCQSNFYVIEMGRKFNWKKNKNRWKPLQKKLNSGRLLQRSSITLYRLTYFGRWAMQIRENFDLSVKNYVLCR